MYSSSGGALITFTASKSFCVCDPLRDFQNVSDHSERRTFEYIQVKIFKGCSHFCLHWYVIKVLQFSQFNKSFRTHLFLLILAKYFIIQISTVIKI